MLIPANFEASPERLYASIDSSKIRILAAVAAGLKASFRSGFPVEVAHGLTYIITTASTFIERDNAGDLVRLFLSTITVIAGS